MTTLVDPEISDQRILDLYHGRWGIETIHREMKSIAQVERWHGKTKTLIDRVARLLLAGFSEPHVDPAGEAVLAVPDTFAVANEYELVHGHFPMAVVRFGREIL